MHDGHQVLRHLLFWRQPLLVQHQHLAPVGFRVVREPFEAEANQPVAVRQDQRLHLATPHRVHQRQEMLAAEVQPAADFLDELDVRHALGHTELFQYAPLVGEVGLLRGAGHAAIGDSPNWAFSRIAGKPGELPYLGFGVEAAVAARPGGGL